MKPYLKIIAAMLIWSTWGVMIRWLALPTVVILFYTALIGGVAVSAYLKGTGRLHLRTFWDSPWLFVVLSLAILANNITFFYALAHTTIANAVFTHYTAPLFVALLAPVMIAERLQKVTLYSLPVAAIGMVMIVLNGGGLLLDQSQMPGILSGTASGLFYALLIIFSRRLSLLERHLTAIVIMLWVSAAATAPMAFLTDHHLTLRSMLLLLIGGVMHSAVAPMLYFSGLRRVMAQHAAILGYIEPLAAVPFAFIFLSETPSLIALFGGLLILFSGYLVIHARPAPDTES